jgi:hypothetical protein
VGLSQRGVRCHRAGAARLAAVFVGADLQPAGNEAELWKDDPHGIA